ncbi:MAG TPA: hypothetical protein VGA03_10890 [Anaerolineales bacterium]
MRFFSRPLEFDYVAWTLNAIGVKSSQYALRVSNYLPAEARRQVVLDYLDLAARIRTAEGHLFNIYGNPEILNPDQASALVRKQLEGLYALRDHTGPLAESILQGQISTIVAESGLSLGGQSIPPVLYHSTPLPTALIVSPREEIRQDANISLLPELAADERSKLEAQVDQALNVSSLVVDIGGIGVYPTMVMQTSDLNYLTEVVAHEWIHNFLTLRPLGINYLTSPELRTMNETTASIAGKEIGRATMERYYPELVPPPPPTPAPPAAETPEPEPPTFEFRVEMRITRETVDALLAEGEVEAAEAYMEERRIFLWENGYQIRKLNQAYFAFHGAYADEPGGAAGEDPVGEAVRALRAQSPSLAAFINRMAWISSFEQLQQAVIETSS